MTIRRSRRLPAIARWARCGFAGLTGATLVTLAGIGSTEDAVANGETRTIEIYHTHTKESASITFKRNGYYDQDALKQLNWLLRDWRTDEPIHMAPQLFDILWEVHREVGSHEPFNVVSAYRSPGTNAMLRRRSKAVAEHSQHMLGHAMDFFLPDVSMRRVREIGMRLQDGGVGFYPNAFNPFVHLDVGSVRSWPRMPRTELARLFPDGKTVHLPRDGHPLAEYEEAKAEILARGGSVAGYSTYAQGGEETGPRKSLWATLFGGDDDEDSDFYRSPTSRVKLASRAAPSGASAYAATGNTGDAGMHEFLVASAAPAAVTEPQPPQPRSRRQRGQAAAPVAVAANAPAQVAQPEPSATSSQGAPQTGSGIPADGSLPEPGATLDGARLAAAIPHPPRRPGDIAALLADTPLPPLRPFALASLQGSAPVVPTQLNGQMSASEPRKPAGGEDRTALKSLFDTVSIRSASPNRIDPQGARAAIGRGNEALTLSEAGPKVRMVFTLAAATDLDTDDFRGAAVAALPILR